MATGAPEAGGSTAVCRCNRVSVLVPVLGWIQTACIALARGSTAVADVAGVHQIALLASSGPETFL